MSFWEELRRRNVVKVGAAYAVVAWLLIQIADVVLPTFAAPEWVARTVTFLIMLGFPVALILAWAYELTPEGVKRTKQVSLSESITHASGRKLDFAIIGLMAVTIVYLIVENYMSEDGTAESAAIAGADVAVEAGSVAATEREPESLTNSVAVLPFENLSPDPDNAYFAAGMHEEILNQLAKLSNLNVISRTTMLRYADERKPLPEIARELNVETVMEGSVRYANDRVLVTVQLIDPETDAQLWSESYPGDLSDVFGIQADIAMNVANSIGAQFSDEEQRRIEKRLTVSPEAYELYLRAQDVRGFSSNGITRMHELLDQAIILDSRFAAAYGRKALGYASELVNVIGSARESTQLESLARLNAERALELDPEEEAALYALGRLASNTWRWTDAKRLYDRAYEVTNSPNSEAIWFTAWFGDRKHALELATHFVDVDPLNWGAYYALGILLNYDGDYDAAAERLRESMALDLVAYLQPLWLAWTEIARGNTDEARQQLQLTERLIGEDRAAFRLVDLAYGYGRIGDIPDARRLFDELSAAVAQGQIVGAGGWAEAHLAIGEQGEALERLREGADKAARKEADAGYFNLMNLRMNMTNDPVLNQPEFADIRNRLRGE